MARRQRLTNEPEPWRRNQLALLVAVFVWFAGTSFVFPFLALYVQQLGDFTVEEIALWTGAALAATPLLSALVGPIWGTIADRAGSKLPLQLSLVGFSAGLGLMAFVVAPWQLIGVRVIMGIFGGFVVSALALVAVSSPPDRVNTGIGLVQAARVLGMGVGPLGGGILADTIGIQNSLVVSVTSGALALALVTLLIQEPDRSSRRRPARAQVHTSLRTLLLAPAFLGILTALFMLRLTERTFDPVLPLLVGRLGASSLGVATTTGIIFSGDLIATSIAAAAAGRFVRSQTAPRAMLLTLALSILFFVPVAFASAWWHLLVLRIAIGLAAGAGTTLALAAGAETMASDRRGFGFGILTSGGQYGVALGSIVAGLISVLSLELIFIVDAALLFIALVVGLVAFRRARIGSPETAQRAASAE